MEEKIFLSAPGVRVGSSHIELRGRRFATPVVASVKVEHTGVSVAAALIALCGLVMMTASTSVLGFALFIAGGAWAYETASRRTLKLDANGREVVVLQTNNRLFAERVRAAVAQAISGRNATTR